MYAMTPSPSPSPSPSSSPSSSPSPPPYPHPSPSPNPHPEPGPSPNQACSTRSRAGSGCPPGASSPRPCACAASARDLHCPSARDEAASRVAPRSWAAASTITILRQPVSGSNGHRHRAPDRGAPARWARFPESLQGSLEILARRCAAWGSGGGRALCTRTVRSWMCQGTYCY